MCGIWALFGYDTKSVAHCDISFSKLRHRGPDAWRIQFDQRVKNACIGFTRLTIVDSVYGMQPMILHKYPQRALICNGELYNCKRLGSEFNLPYETCCDVECILQLFGLTGSIEETVCRLDGVFAFVLVDSETMKVYVARDPYGVRPLFRLTTDSGVLGLASEGKGLIKLGQQVLNGSKWSLKQFPPGCFAEYDILSDGSIKLVREKRYYSIGSIPKFTPFVPMSDLGGDVLKNIRLLLTEAVRKRLMSERRIGCMLSGGLDSSLIAALLVKLAKENGLPYKIQTFSVGMGSSPDMIAAKQVAEHIGSEHHAVTFNEGDVERIIDQVIYQLETADITTVRASIGMYIVSEYILKNSETTVVLSGEGADELAQGYIYFRDAPTAHDGHLESIRLLEDIHLYDGLRADRTTAAHSLELRVPFLDLQFTWFFLSLPESTRTPQDGVEKHLLRSAFQGTGLLPDNILWRHKEAFSDGVASIKKSLFQVIQDIIEPKIPDEALKSAKDKYPHLTPLTKEALYYRQVFESHFPGQCQYLTPYYWMPKWTNVTDPSARFIKHYAADKAD